MIGATLLALLLTAPAAGGDEYHATLDPTNSGSFQVTAIDNTVSQYASNHHGSDGVLAADANGGSGRVLLPKIVWDCRLLIATVIDGVSSGTLECWESTIASPSFMDYRYFHYSDGQPLLAEGEAPPAVVVTQQDFQSLPIDPGDLVRQPPSDDVLINVETIAYLDATEQVLATELLGTPVEVRATPVEWSWDFGGGTTPFTTDDPGAPYPNHTVSATYTHVLDAVEIDLTITWEGEFSVNGGPWLPILGTATTTSTTPPFATEDAPTHLVTGPLDG